MEQTHEKKALHDPAEVYMTDGGCETSMLFLWKFDLPCFAVFNLCYREEGVKGLKEWFSQFMELSKQYNVPMVIETPTWRANKDWAEKLGLDSERLEWGIRFLVKML